MIRQLWLLVRDNAYVFICSESSFATWIWAGWSENCTFPHFQNFIQEFISIALAMLRYIWNNLSYILLAVVTYGCGVMPGPTLFPDVKQGLRAAKVFDIRWSSRDRVTPSNIDVLKPRDLKGHVLDSPLNLGTLLCRTWSLRKTGLTQVSSKSISTVFTNYQELTQWFRLQMVHIWYKTSSSELINLGK